MDNLTPKNPRNTRKLQNPWLGLLWQPAGVIYLLLCLAALAAGLWPDTIYPPKADFRSAPLPTLQTLAVGQVIWFLLVSPLVQVFRDSRNRTSSHRPRQSRLRHEIVETLGLFIVAVPFYIAAGWLADATVTDCLRTALAVAAFCPLGWLAGWLLAGRQGNVLRSCVLAGLLAITVGQVGLYYIFIEFLPPVSAGWIWHSCPATFVWSAAASRNPAIVPEPLWAMLLWLGVALAGGAILWAKQSTRQRSLAK
ncbi:MAG: hypothetical protein K8S55_00565 [Phycisphaerae bacterium]|nr:hypothetical protein [Phycisphaerae bacterium]